MPMSLVALALLAGGSASAEPLAAPAAAEPATVATAAADPAALPAPATTDEPDETWNGSVNLGATISGGNADVVTASAAAEGKKEWEKNRVTLRANWAFAQQEDNTTGVTDVTQRRWTGMGKYDRFWSERSYGLATVSLVNDDIADLHLRSMYGVGAGHKISVEEDFKLDGEAGVSWVDENYFGTADDDDYFALRLAYDLDKKLSETTRFQQTAEAFPSLDFSEFNGTLDSRVRVSLTDKMFAQVQWIARYNNNAPPGTGSTDNLWILSLGWEF